MPFIDFESIQTNVRNSVPDSITDITGQANEIARNFQNQLQNFETVGRDFTRTFDNFSLGNIGNTISSGVGNIVGSISEAITDSATSVFENITESIEGELPNLFANLSDSVNFNPNRGGSTSFPFDSESGKLANPLRKYSSYNYIIEFGALTPSQFNAPESGYRTLTGSGLSILIIRSGGGGYTRRVTTFEEDPLHAEYFIEDLEVDSVIAPNSNTSVALGTTVSFKVVEPYSMGKFLEALQIASIEANGDGSNYLETVFCLAISFNGWDDGEGSNTSGPDDGLRGNSNGTQYTDIPTKYIPIKLTNMEMDVNESGTTYEIKAVPYNEFQLSNEIQEMKTDVNVSGTTVAEVLETSESSLTNSVNDRAEIFEERGFVTNGDRFIIMFPTSEQGATEAIEQGQSSFDGVSINVDGEVQNSQDFQGTQTVNLSTNDIYATLKNYADNNINEIGLSVMTSGPLEGGNQPAPEANTIIPDDGFRPVRRNEPGLQPATNRRLYTFGQTETITSIIEEIILNSEYARENSTTEPRNGLYKWFKIETQTFISEDVNQLRRNGQHPKVYVYSVVPFFSDEAKQMGSGRRPDGTNLLRQLAIKEYNYIYTGKNEDVLDFDLQFNNTFFQNISSDRNQLSGADIAGTANEVTDTGERLTTRAPEGEQIPSSPDSLPETQAPTVEVAQRPTRFGGGRQTASTAVKRSIAERFHNNLINSQVDLVTADLEIWGDPYYIPTSGMGNYNAPGMSNRVFVNVDGTINYQRSEVFILVNFRTPLDYNALNGLMTFSQIQKPFSGLFQVWAVTNKFYDGKFTQTLKLLRRRGQNDDATGDTQAVQIDGDRTSDLRPNHNGGGTGGPVGNTSSVPRTGATAPGAQGDGLRGNGGGSSSVDTPSAGDGTLATIRTSKRGLETEVSSAAAENLQGLIDALENEYGYEITSLGGYSRRRIRRSDGSLGPWSWHASGVAIDINPNSNPANFGGPLVTDLPNPPNGSEMVQLAARFGLGWGGNWPNYKDSMHFSLAQGEQGSASDVVRGEIY